MKKRLIPLEIQNSLNPKREQTFLIADYLTHKNVNNSMINIFNFSKCLSLVSISSDKKPVIGNNL